MKKFIVLAALLVSANAFAASETFLVCNGESASAIMNGGEHSNCRWVTRTVKPSSGTTVEVKCANGDAPAACAPASAGVPSWLKKLNGMFPNNSAPKQKCGNGDAPC